MSRFIREQSFWISHSGITLKFTLGRWTPFKRLHQSFATYLIGHMKLVTTYDTKEGTTGDIKQRVWRSPNS